MEKKEGKGNYPLDAPDKDKPPTWKTVPHFVDRFHQAEIIVDGYEEECVRYDLDGERKTLCPKYAPYKEFQFNENWNKFKFFRIHNLNNYDMIYRSTFNTLKEDILKKI